MVQISHKQAQYLIRQAEGRPLPDERWAVLEDHLAHCADCRAYRDQRARLEQRARRLFLLRWQGIVGPAPGIAEAVQSARRRQAARWRAALKAAGSLALLFLIWLASRPGTPLNPLPTARPTQQVMQATLTPTPSARFTGNVAFQASPAGNAEIYLLNAGPSAAELTNLTQNPAEDIDPTWSPDGEWLAFLSDRSGKPEVYVISIAGTRLTQLTHDPGMTWSGPLAWSQDGRWLALIGLRDHQGNDAWVYLISVGGASSDAAPQRVPGTHNVTGPLRFYTVESHHQYLTSSVPPGRDKDFVTYLVYPLQGTNVLMRYDMQTGRVDPLNFVEIQAPSEHITGAGDFAYTVNNQMETAFYLVALDSMLKNSLPIPHIATALRRAVLNANTGDAWITQVAVTASGRVRALSDLPADPRIAYLTDLNDTGCYQLNLYRDSAPAVVSPVLRRIPDFCVDGGLDSAQWQSGARWVVVWGHEPLASQPALYALKVGVGDDGAAILNRLAPLQKGSGEPRVRPEGVASLNLNPQPAALHHPVIAGYDMPLALLKALVATGPAAPLTLTQSAPAEADQQAAPARTPAARPESPPVGSLTGRTIQKLSPR